MFDIV
jgi:hypothetical protein